MMNRPQMSNKTKGRSMRNQSLLSFKNMGYALITACFLSVAMLGAPQAEAKNYLKLSKNAIGKSQTVKVGLNKSMVIDLPDDAHDILVANPVVADAITRTSRRIYIFAKQVGSTNIFIFDSRGKQLLSIDLEIERDIAGLEGHLKKYIRGSDISVEMLNDNVILTGTVPTPQASAMAVQLARIFVTGGEATSNQYNQNTATSSGGGTTIVFGDDERQLSQIVNLLSIDGEDQVHLKVTIAEIQRTVAKQLGVDLSATGFSVGNVAIGALSQNPYLLSQVTSGTNVRATHTAHGQKTIDTLLRALDQTGVMRTLAEPTLTAISGETASFKVGGEYNVAETIDEDGTTFRQVEYGVGLAFRPVVLGPGRISLHIKTQVSEPTTESAKTAGGGVLPGVRRREAETTVELPSGGSMILAGLLKDDVRQTASGFPGLRRIPILGALFKSRDFQRYETELVIIATPYLVRPTARANLARPDDNFNPTSDVSGIFLGQLNKIYGTPTGGSPKGRYHGNVGFIYK